MTRTTSRRHGAVARATDGRSDAELADPVLGLVLPFCRSRIGSVSTWWRVEQRQLCSIRGLEHA